MAKSSKQRYRSQLAEPLNDHTIAKNFPKRCKSQLALPRMIRQLLKIIKKKRCKSQLVEPLNDHIAKNSTSQLVEPLNDHTITIKKTASPSFHSLCRESRWWEGSRQGDGEPVYRPLLDDQ